MQYSCPSRSSKQGRCSGLGFVNDSTLPIIRRSRPGSLGLAPRKGHTPMENSGRWINEQFQLRVDETEKASILSYKRRRKSKQDRIIIIISP
jgi:hypothetical protein